MCENDGKKRNIELSFLITYQDAFHLKIALLGYTPYVGVYIRAGDIFFEKASVGLRCKVLLRLVFASSLPDLAGFAKKNRDDCTVVSVFFANRMEALISFLYVTGKCKPEIGTAAFLTFNSEGRIVQKQDVFYNGKPDPAADRCTFMRGIRTVISIPNEGKLFLGNALAAVNYINSDIRLLVGRIGTLYNLYSFLFSAV